MKDRLRYVDAARATGRIEDEENNEEEVDMSVWESKPASSRRGLAGL